MDIFLLITSAICGAAKNLLSRFCSKNSDKNSSLYFVNFLIFSVAFILSLIFGFKSLNSISLYTVITSVIYALLTIFGQALYMKAVQHGEVAMSSLIYSCGFIIPSVSGALFYSEVITHLQICGFLLLLYSLFLGTGFNFKYNKKWFLYAFGAMLCSGLVGLLQKIFRMSKFCGELDIFLIFAFFVMAVLSFFMCLPTIKAKENKASAIPASVLGVVVFSANKINLYLSGVLESIILFPVVNGGCVILSAFGAKLFFKETLSLKKKFSIFLGIISIILMV